MQNGFVESFNGRLRDECLNEHLFDNLKVAREIIKEWRIDYNTNRPHTSLNGLTPTEFAVRPHPGHSRSTGFPGTKQSSGARPARSCLLSMHWIVVNHKREGAVSGVGGRQQPPPCERDDC
jgi:putative transposase